MSARAVEDAFLGGLGTLLQLGVAVFPVWFGFVIAVSGVGSSTEGTVAGGFLVAVGRYRAGTTLGDVPGVPASAAGVPSASAFDVEGTKPCRTVD